MSQPVAMRQLRMDEWQLMEGFYAELARLDAQLQSAAERVRRRKLAVLNSILRVAQALEPRMREPDSIVQYDVDRRCFVEIARPE